MGLKDKIPIPLKKNTYKGLKFGKCFVNEQGELECNDIRDPDTGDVIEKASATHNEQGVEMQEIEAKEGNSVSQKTAMRVKALFHKLNSEVKL